MYTSVHDINWVNKTKNMENKRTQKLAHTFSRVYVGNKYVATGQAGGTRHRWKKWRSKHPLFTKTTPPQLLTDIYRIYVEMLIVIRLFPPWTPISRLGPQ